MWLRYSSIPLLTIPYYIYNTILPIFDIALLRLACKAQKCTQTLHRLQRKSVACRGGCGRCDGPRHPPWGHPNGQFLKKNVGNWQKMKRKMSLPGHDAARDGASRERIVLKVDNC